ncbi:hypothetical protein CLG96_00360 [Sphingomonas oleivorans]|uniref:Uncharacterized protein n=1 Tax=Sphingomonas oleivorans TaxID=1735121 RepID=A0A2T5G0I5_9SPHN|nr:hypothetical protein [Sphingomonas oleivorans]PTQ12659.1 hypothetical protein CLG96_00360 [Sphingomonas oleivorans]
MMLEFAHSVPGRLRLQGRPFDRDPGTAGLVRRKLLQIAGVERVTTNGATGSYVIWYDRYSLSFDELWDHLLEARLVGFGSAGPARAGDGPDLGQALVEAASRTLLTKLAERSAGALLCALI